MHSHPLFIRRLTGAPNNHICRPSGPFVKLHDKILSESIATSDKSEYTLGLRSTIHKSSSCRTETHSRTERETIRDRARLPGCVLLVLIKNHAHERGVLHRTTAQSLHSRQSLMAYKSLNCSDTEKLLSVLNGLILLGHYTNVRLFLKRIIYLTICLHLFIANF